MSAEQINIFLIVWLGIGTVVVLIAAGLLLTIISLASKIAALAATALDVVVDIGLYTTPIWQAATTDQVAGQLQGGAQAICGNAETIVAAVS